MHFTYQSPEGDLQQGDLLRRTPQIERLLEEFHPYYHRKEDYLNLLVLTQSCDLVSDRALGARKAEYITLCVARPVGALIVRRLARYQRSDREGRLRYCSLDSRPTFKQFLERLWNNNEAGYFYLHSEPELGIAQPMVAFLALSVAIKAEHYSTCLDARVAQLKEPFQAKLGWLTGDMYSRVATDDWVPTVYNSDEFDKRLEAELERICLWVDDRFMPKIAKAEKGLQRERGEGYQMSEDDLLEVVDRLKQERESRKDQIIERMIEILAETNPDLDRHKLRLRLKNDPTIAQHMR